MTDFFCSSLEKGHMIYMIRKVEYLSFGDFSDILEDVQAIGNIRSNFPIYFISVAVYSNLY